MPPGRSEDGGGPYFGRYAAVQIPPIPLVAVERAVLDHDLVIVLVATVEPLHVDPLQAVRMQPLLGALVHFEIVVSDHGMIETRRERVVYVEDILDPATVHIVNVSPILMVRPRGPDTTGIVTALRRLPHVTTWRRSEIPERLHFSNHRRITPIVGLADEGWTIQVRRRGERPPPAGMHGYDNQLASMRALFVARGPSFRRGARIGEFENVNVYALLAHLLRIEPAPNSGSLSPFLRALR
jgi:predicted AlkP superfamily pyrophosphatase or phosphodiesterase